MGLTENWRHGSNTDPYIGSVTLPREVLPFVGIFALLEGGCRVDWVTEAPHGMIGIDPSDSDEEVDCFKRFHGDDLVRRFTYSDTAGDRIRPTMSGWVR